MFFDDMLENTNKREENTKYLHHGPEKEGLCMCVDLFSSTISTYANLTGFKQILCAILSMCLLK